MIRRKKEEWASIIASWEGSGLSMRSYCRENDISYWSFRENRKRHESTCIPVSSGRKLVRVSHERVLPPSSPITIIFSNKIKLEIPDGFNPDTLQRVINVLGAVQ